MQNKIKQWQTSAHRTSLLLIVITSLVALVGCDNGTEDTSSVDATGRGSSTARMTISGDYLYAIVNDKIQVLDISTPEAPNPLNRITLDYNINSIFPYDDYLLVASDNGFRILDNTVPTSPRDTANIPLFNGPNPVVAEAGIAYVSQRSERYYNNSDQLEIIDISDLNNPFSVNTIAMQSPSGLSVDGDRLFVCDDIAGIKVFDLANKTNPVLLQGVNGVECNDVIAFEGILYAIAEEALLQYNYNTEPPSLLSEIATPKTE